MAITTYAELQSAVNNWREGNDSADRLKEFIALAEARLNRMLGAVETNATLTGTPGNRNLSIASLSVVRPIALWMSVSGGEISIQPRAEGAFAYDETPGVPQTVGLTGPDLVLNRPLDAAYSFRFHYRERFALSDAAPTNWLLTNHPDVYLAASMMWGAGYHEMAPMGAAWKAVLDEGIAEIRSEIAARKRSVLRVDPALLGSARRDVVGWG